MPDSKPDLQMPAPPDGLQRLWPTVILTRTIPGHEAPNRELFRHIKALESEHANLTTDYLSANLFEDEHPGVQWLRECVNVTVGDYLAAATIDYEVRWRLHGWANINRFGDYHDYHNHPHAYLSGTYYVRLPTEREKLRTREDLRPGCLTLYDPRSSANMTAIRDDPNVNPEHTIHPRAGLIVLWPAFVNHFVHPNLSKQLRVSVSFNVMLKWRDEYRPGQAYS